MSSTNTNKNLCVKQATSREELQVDVIIRTLANRSRKSQLFCAIDSVLSQEQVQATVIVVANGNVYDDAIIDALRQHSKVRFCYVPKASTSCAVSAGRSLVKAPFFMYLDDDDQLIAGSLAPMLSRLYFAAEKDVIITNGYSLIGGEGVKPLFPHLSFCETNPLLGLLQESWLFPGAFICRTKSVPPSLFEVNRDHQEWTAINLLLVRFGKKFEFFDIPTVQYNDTPGSLSKGVVHQQAAISLMDELLTQNWLPSEAINAIREKRIRLLHGLADMHWRKRNLQAAWRYHLQSLRPPGTMRYLMFTRKLFGRPPEDIQ